MLCASVPLKQKQQVVWWCTPKIPELGSGKRIRNSVSYLLHSKSEANLGYVRPCLKKEPKKELGKPKHDDRGRSIMSSKPTWDIPTLGKKEKEREKQLMLIRPQ